MEAVNSAPAAQSVKLDFMDIVQSGIETGVKNLVPLLVAVLLWIVTIWIPYINIGTTIAICTIPAALSKGEVITPTFIFDKKYRQFMGEFFLTVGFINMAVVPAMFMFIFPGIILLLAWSQALFLVLDKGLNPLEAMTQSNRMMDGNKLVAFGIYAALGIGFFIVSFVASYIPFLGHIIRFAASIAYMMFTLGVAGVIYGRLTGKTAKPA